MNHHHQPGSLANYNSLTDKHLTGYFSNTRIRRHLLRSGLISRSGRIIPEREYHLNALRKDHKKYIRECLAQAIFQKVLEMERHHQGEIKRKMENSVRREHIHRIKVDHSRKKIEETDYQFSPHPPTGPRDHFRRRRLGDRGQSIHLASTPRPSTAPGNIQHPVRLQPLCGFTTESTSKATSSSRTKFHTLEKERLFSSAGDRGASRAMFSTDYSSGISPYRFPMINNYMIPIPPPKSEKNMNARKAATSRGRRLRPATAPNGLEQLLAKDTGRFHKPEVHSNACVTMVYLGRTVHLSYDLFDYREEVKVYQQHCGGENLCVYRGKLLEGETFQFISRRHYGYPFSLTFYLNGIQVDRLSSCCEYKHRKGTRLGGKHGYFGFVDVERSAPCYRCIIAMGLDKKPSPPKKKVADEDEAKKVEFTSLEKEEVKEGLSERSSSSRGKSKDSQSQSLHAEEGKEDVEGTEEMEWESKKGNIQDTSEGNEKYQKYAAYNEDFEADEGKSDEKVNEEGQAGDQMKGMSKSPSDDEKDNLDHERENKISSPKALQGTDSERDESDGYMESESEEGKQGRDKPADWEIEAAARKIQCLYRKHKGRVQMEGAKPDKKRASSSSSSSMLCSSENVSDSETRKQGDEQDNIDIHSEYESETTKSQRGERQEIDMGEEEDGGKTEDSTAQDTPDASFGRRMETDVEDTGSLSEKLSFVGSLDMDMREGTEEEMLTRYRGSIQKETARSQMPSSDEEEGESISVKEKIAEDIEHDQLLSSEPEPSDSNAEYEEEDAVATGYKQEESISVKEKIAEDIEHDQLLSSEPEPSDSSAEYEEEDAVATGYKQEESLSVKEKIAEDIEYDQLLSSEPEPSDSNAEYEEEDAVATGYKQEVADGASLAKGSGEFISETVAEQERQMVGKEGALEEEELLDQEGPEETIPEEEFLAKENDGKDQLLREETELEKEAEITSDIDDRKEDEMHEKVKSSEGELETKGEMKEPDEMSPDHGISDGEETSEGYMLEGEEIEDQSITGDLIGVGEDEKGIIEAYEMLGTAELMGEKATEREVHETEETLKEADEAPETAFAEEIQENMEEAEFEGYEILPEEEHGAEGVVEVKLTDGEDVGVTLSKDEGCLEESEDVEIKLEKAAFTEIEFRVPDSKMEEIIPMNEEGVASEKLVDEDGFTQEIPHDMEDSVQEESCIGEGDLEKMSPERSKVGSASTEEHPLDHDDTERVILRTEEETMKGKGATINGQEEELASVLHSGGKSEIEDPTIEIMARTKETVLEDVNIVGIFEEKREQRGRDEIPELEVTFQKKELSTDVVPEALPFATEESTKAKRNVVIKGETEAEETERKVMVKGKVKAERTKRKEAIEGDEEDEATQRLLTVKWKVKDEDSESEGEVMSLVTESEGEPTSEMTIMRWQNIVNKKEDVAAEAEEGPESFAQKVTSTGGLNKEKRMENEPDVQGELEETPEETEHTSVYMKIQKEEVTDDEEKEDEGSDKEEQVTGEQITLADVEEALLIGIQQFITEVSRMNEEVEDKEEEPPAEELAEERANPKDPERDDLFLAVMTKRWQTESEKVEERGIGEPMDRTPVKGNIGDRKEITRQEESPEENQTVTEIIQWSTERSDGGQH